MGKGYDTLLKEKGGIRLDIGCGSSKQPGFVGIDKMALPGVDIVHDLEKTPWPLPDNCVIQALASHVLEHIDPAQGTFLRVMDEIWRVLKPGSRFMFAVPYAGSPGYWQDPTHCNGITERTLWYFDPLAKGGALYGFYKPKPWNIITNAWTIDGNLEAVLEKRTIDPSYGVRA